MFSIDFDKHRINQLILDMFLQHSLICDEKELYRLSSLIYEIIILKKYFIDIIR